LGINYPTQDWSCEDLGLRIPKVQDIKANRNKTVCVPSNWNKAGNILSHLYGKWVSYEEVGSISIARRLRIYNGVPCTTLCLNDTRFPFNKSLHFGQFILYPTTTT